MKNDPVILKEIAKNLVIDLGDMVMLSLKIHVSEIKCDSFYFNSVLDLQCRSFSYLLCLFLYNSLGSVLCDYFLPLLVYCLSTEMQ